MSAGARNQRVSLQQPSYAADAYGDLTKAVWFTIATLWVQIESLAENISGRAAAEIINSGQVVGLNSFRVKMIYRQGVTSQMRFVWGSRYLQILGVPDLIDDKGEMQVLCKEQV